MSRLSLFVIATSQVLSAAGHTLTLVSPSNEGSRAHWHLARANARLSKRHCSVTFGKSEGL